MKENIETIAQAYTSVCAGGMEMNDRVAPWKDFAGNDIREGDRICHPDGTSGTVAFFDFENEPGDQWRVAYPSGDGGFTFSRLLLQVGEKGQAVVVENRDPKTAEARAVPR